ncbi:hypothetical protein [Sphaerisporangium sp. TRM90804]|uniref:tetratricopeptide repeat protein n=1 Tax=Sphaerisporangium sp. TRM90804 TaxID=3031113 RepID=UPI00244965EF|nr:hypothetical protein [Sphaerisporangium sp. TRM90804]MDH2425393.1 hypothetical protein [Sphaerisporangium sp. TRM90804]
MKLLYGEAGLGREPQPFDAHKALLCEDHSGSRESWQAISLVTEMKQALLARFTAKPDLSKIEAFEAAAAELTRRGVDADSLVRYGMIGEILGPVFVVLLIDKILPQSDSGDHLRGFGVDIEGWRSLLRVPAQVPESNDEFTSLVNSTITSVTPPLVNWVGRARLAALVSLEVPDGREFWTRANLPADHLTLVTEYRWLVERLTETYMKSWSKASLLLEYRYRHNLQPMSFPGWVLEARDVPLGDVTTAIAHRAAVEWNPLSDGPPRTAFMPAGITEHARELLANGRAMDAAALFEFAVRQWPNDVSARNNLGFCLMPVDPARALTHLNMAARQGYEPIAVNVYNRMCCHVALRQPRAALDVAEQWWKEVPYRHDQPDKTLWLPSNSGWRLERSASAESAIMELVLLVTQDEGLQNEEQRWRARAD